MAKCRQEKRLRVGVIYKITYPNGKIYIGQDRTDDINYFGSADSFTIAKDFTEMQRKDFVVWREILVRIKGCTIREFNAEEQAAILRYRSRDPKVGYNRTNRPRKLCSTVWL